MRELAIVSALAFAAVVLTLCGMVSEHVYFAGTCAGAALVFLARTVAITVRAAL